MALPLNTLKEYLQKNNLGLYGKKEEIVRRINDILRELIKVLC